MNAALPETAARAFQGWENPMGTDGFEFIEYAAPDPVAMGQLFERMGFRAIARRLPGKELRAARGRIRHPDALLALGQRRRVVDG